MSQHRLAEYDQHSALQRSQLLSYGDSINSRRMLSDSGIINTGSLASVDVGCVVPGDSGITRSAGPAPCPQSAAGRSGTQHVGRHPEKAYKSPIFDSPVRHVVDIKYLMSHNNKRWRTFSLDCDNYLIVRPFGVL